MTAHHRFVKTTPNPRATKNSSGELPPPPLPPLPDDEVALGEAEVAVCDMTRVLEGVDEMADELLASWTALSTT